MGKKSGVYFTKKTFAFLKDLARNNNREWFQANKSAYEEEVKEPSLRFIVDFADHLEGISPHFRADPRGNGGSLFRMFQGGCGLHDRVHQTLQSWEPSHGLSLQDAGDPLLTTCRVLETFQTDNVPWS